MLLLRLQTVEGESEVADLVTRIPDGAHCAERRVYHVAVGHHVGLRDTDDFEDQTVHLDVFADEPRHFLRTVDQTLRKSLRNHGHLAQFPDVIGIYEAPVQHLYLLHQGPFGETALDIAAAVPVAVVDGHGSADGRGHIVNVPGENAAPRQVDVALVKLYGTVGLEAGIRFRGPAAADTHRIGGQHAAAHHERVEHSVARAEQHDDHEYAPCDREARQAGAQLVAAHAFDYFGEKIPHFIIVSAPKRDA